MEKELREEEERIALAKAEEERVAAVEAEQEQERQRVAEAKAEEERVAVAQAQVEEERVAEAQAEPEPETQEAPAKEEAPAPQEKPVKTASSSSRSVGSFQSTAYAIGDGMTPSVTTANGTNVANTIYSGGHRIVAVDPSVIPLGSIVKVTYPNGESLTAVAADTGGRIKGNIIDLLVSSPAEAQSYGRQSGISVSIIN